jgi:UTP--glucose-1-phosphate uridylyltransferase
MDLVKAFENASTNVAAAQMRNALTELAETVKDPDEKKVIQSLPPYPPIRSVPNIFWQLFETEMDNFFSLFRRYLNDKAKGNAVYVITSCYLAKHNPLTWPN